MSREINKFSFIFHKFFQKCKKYYQDKSALIFDLNIIAEITVIAVPNIVIIINGKMNSSNPKLREIDERAVSVQ